MDVETQEVKEKKEIIALKEDIRKLEEKNETFKTNINQKTKELEKAREEVKELKQINDLLLNDVKQVNEKVMKVLVPSALQKENEELKETIEILQTVIDIYKQAEIDEEQVRDKTDESGYAAKNPKQAVHLKYNCGYCNFTSNSNHGVNVHIGLVHKKQEEDSQLIRF